MPPSRRGPARTVASTPLSEFYRTAFVTGASAGLGRAFATMLLQQGVRVWGTSRDPARLTELTAAHPAQFTPVVLDLAEADAAARALEQAQRDAGGAFDLVVNNAGYGVYGRYDAGEFATWQAQLDTMLVSTMRLAHVALRAMRNARRGCLVNVSSLAVEFPLPFMSGYNAAKAGLAAFSESLVIETRGTGITVVDLRLGDFRTDFNQTMQTVTFPASPGDAELDRAWAVLEANLRAAPPPAVAAEGLRRALLRRRSGTVRLGSFFQARLASVGASLIPAAWRRRLARAYFGL